MFSVDFTNLIEDIYTARPEPATATTMSRYLIITKRTGRLGNRLTLAAHCLAAAQERGWILMNATLEEYAQHFVGPSVDAIVCAMPRPTDRKRVPEFTRPLAYGVGRVAWQLSKGLKRIPGIPVAAEKALRRDHRDLGPIVISAEERGARLLALQGYHFRHHPWAQNQADAIRTYFAPLPEIRAEAERVVAAARADADAVIGVHIRHGDYASHLDGRFFYPVQTYLRLMRDARALLAPRRVAFLIFSNAEHAANEFAEFDATPGPGGLVSDLHALSLCDRIIGPPSSYSSWSAFYGRVPIARVQEPDRRLTPADFEVLESPHPLY